MAQVNAPSILLSDEENELLFTLVGSRRQTKASAVVQMFHAQVDSRDSWTKFRTGVLCFIKDNPKKSYYIRLYDLTTKSMIYEQEIYNQFAYSKDRLFFHSYPGDKFMVGLNFASEEEAEKFYTAVNSKLQEREKRATIRRTKENTSGGPTAISRAPVNTVDAGMDPFSGSNKKAKPKKPKGKLSKSDIGAPSDFRHLSHVGFDPSTGAFDSSNISPEWKQLLDHVGVTNEELKNKDTATFIYDFVEKHGGIQEANRQLREASTRSAPPPPPPSRKTPGGRDRDLPPPPPNKNRGAPPPPPSSRGGPPPPPPAGGPAPPPPPPPPPIGGPAAPPPPPIKAGGAPPPPPPSRGDKPNPNLPTVSDERGDLLASIRKGKQLKKVAVDESSHNVSPPPDSGGGLSITDALLRALHQRQTAIQNSDKDSDEDEEDDDDEWLDS